MDWSKSSNQFIPPRGEPQAAVLINHRLCFPAFDVFLKGGVADVVPEAGKSVGGALFNLTETAISLLDKMLDRKQDRHGKELGVRRRVLVDARPYNSRQTVRAQVYRLRQLEHHHVPPTERYMKRLKDAAWQMGLSSSWIMHLQSFSSQESAWQKSTVRCETLQRRVALEDACLKRGQLPPHVSLGLPEVLTRTSFDEHDELISR